MMVAGGRLLSVGVDLLRQRRNGRQVRAQDVHDVLVLAPDRMRPQLVHGIDAVLLQQRHVDEHALRR